MFDLSKKQWGGRGAEGARNEAPKAPRGVGCGEGLSPSPLGEGSGEGAVPPPQKNFQFWSSKWQVLVHSGYYFYRSVACFISAHLLFFYCMYAYVVAVICLSQSVCLPVIFLNSLFCYNGCQDRRVPDRQRPKIHS